MAIKIIGSTIIDDSRNIVNAGIATVTSVSIGNTQVISSARQLQNIASLDATTTATIEAAIQNAPNTFTDLQVTGISTLGVTSATNLTAQQLNVTGISTISVNSSSDALRITQEGSGNALVVEDSTNPDATPFVITGSGNIGIGTTNPSDKLHVFGGNTRIDSASGALTFWSGAGFFGGIGVANAFGGTGNNMLVRADAGRSIIFQSGGANERVRIFDTGEVGIGTTVLTGTTSQRLQVTGGGYFSGAVGIGSTNPQERLDVQGGNGFVRIGEVYSTFNGITLNNSTTDSDYNFISSPADRRLFINSPIGINFRIADADKLILTSGGNVLVNTTTATGTSSQPLQVTGGAYVSGNLGIGNTNPTSTLMVQGDGRFVSSGQGDVTITHSSLVSTIRAAASVQLALGAGGAEAVRINTSNNVGINSTTPTSRLDVVGDAKVSGVVTASQFSTGSGNLGFTTDTISGPSIILIDPSPVGVGTTSGAVRILGDLYVDGTQFIVNSTTIELADFNVGIATTVGTNLLLDGAGIGIGSANIRKTITWNNTAGALTSSEDWNLASGKQYEIGGTSVLSSNTLGSGVVNSSLTSVGTLGQLNVSGVSTFSNNINIASGIITTTGSSGVGIGSFLRLKPYATEGGEIAFDYINGSIGYYIDVDAGNILRFGNYDSTGQFRFVTNSTEKLRITNAGELLVGTSTATGTASQPLQVTGGGYFSGSAGVGIGITNPVSKLVLAGETVQFPNSLLILSTLHATSRRAAIGLGGTSGSQNPDWLILQDTNGNGTKDFAIYSGAVAQNQFRIDTNGNVILAQNTAPVLVGTATSTGTANQRLQVSGGAYVSGAVGIGTTNPLSTSSALHINNASYHGISGDALLRLVATGGVNYVQSGITATSGSSAPLVFGSILAGSEWARFTSSGTFLVGSATSTGTASQALQVNSGGYFNGSVGIGRTNPSALLHLTGGSAIGAILERNSTGESYIRYQNSSGTMHAGISTGATFWGIGDSTNFTTAPYFVVTNTTGNVGIGTTNPTSRLQVQGDTFISGVLTAVNGIRGIGIQSGGISITTGIITTLNFTGSAVSTITNTSGLVEINVKANQFTRVSSSFTATAGQTTFSASYTPNYVDVFVNGVRLTASEYNASSGSSIILNDAAFAGDIIDVIAIQNGGLFDTSKWTAADTSNPISGNIYKGSGNVGIGTTNPLGRLQVGAGTSTFIVTGIGSVGIGSTDPQRRLDVLGGSGFVRIGEVFGGYNGITLNNDTAVNNYNILSSPSDRDLYINRPTGNNIRFRSVNNDQMILTGAGNLGIGTITPVGPLQVGIGSTAFVVTGIGSVGIGTTNPTSALTISRNQSGIVNSSHLNFENPASSNAQTTLAFTYGGSIRSSIRVDGNGNYVTNANGNAFYYNVDYGNNTFSFLTSGSTTPWMQVTGGNKVGIATNNATATLQVKDALAFETTNTTTTTTSQVAVDSFGITTFRSAKYQVQVTCPGQISTLGGITTGGRGYTAGTFNVTFTTSSGNGSAAQGTLVISNGTVGQISVSAAGTGYVTGDVLTASGGSGLQVSVASTGASGNITALTLTSAGIGYTAGVGVGTTSLTLLGGTGFNAVGLATILDGVITSSTLLQQPTTGTGGTTYYAGSGYATTSVLSVDRTTLTNTITGINTSVGVSTFTSLTAHGIGVSDVIRVSSTSNGLTAGTDYYVVTVPSTTTFTLGTSVGVGTTFVAGSSLSIGFYRNSANAGGAVTYTNAITGVSTNFQASDLMVLQNGTTADFIEYATIANSDILGTFASDISGSNARLLFTPTYPDNTIKVARQAITV